MGVSLTSLAVVVFASASIILLCSSDFAAASAFSYAGSAAQFVTSPGSLVRSVSTRARNFPESL